MSVYLQLLRIRSVRRPRQDWPSRWSAAARAVRNKGVVYLRDEKGNPTDDMVATSDSPIWKALSKGEGGFRDATGEGKPPFAFGSGLGWERFTMPHQEKNEEVEIEKKMRTVESKIGREVTTELKPLKMTLALNVVLTKG